MSYAFCDKCGKRKKENPGIWTYDEDGHTYCPSCNGIGKMDKHLSMCQCKECWGRSMHYLKRLEAREKA